MDYRNQILESIGRLLSYPTAMYVQSSEFLYVLLRGGIPEAAGCIQEFGAVVEPMELHEQEEFYARTFDINPACALEIGWHLFGEEYARGLLLVRLREELHQRGIEETAELPDHLFHVLAVIAAMTDAEAERFVHACVLPAVAKMQKALDDADNAYRYVIRCLWLVLEHEFGRLDTSAVQRSEENDRPIRPLGDPLREYPMPLGSEVPVQLVQIELNGRPVDGRGERHAR